MEISLYVEVNCVDGRCGRPSYVVINPITEQMTHLVVRGEERPHNERLVPAELITDGNQKGIMLSCTRKEWAHFAPFYTTEFIEAQIPEYEAGSIYLWPYETTTTKTEYIPETTQNLPLHTRDVRRGAHVEAIDGRVGRVDEFLVDPHNLRITHLVMREGHLWDAKDVSIPVEYIDQLTEDIVYLRLNKSRCGEIASHCAAQASAEPSIKRYEAIHCPNHTRYKHSQEKECGKMKAKHQKALTETTNGVELEVLIAVKPDRSVPLQLATPTDLTQEAVAAVTQALNGLVADTFALYVKTKNYHWHLATRHFRDYHLLFDEQADQLIASIDPLAERVRRIGGTTIRSIGHVGQLQSIPDSNKNFVPLDQMVQELLADNLFMAKAQRAAMELADEMRDYPTSNLLQGLLDETEKRIWFLHASFEYID